MIELKQLMGHFNISRHHIIRLFKIPDVLSPVHTKPNIVYVRDKFNNREQPETDRKYRFRTFKDTVDEAR